MYQPKTDFWTPQQREAFELSRDREFFALFMDPRTGKSKVIIDTAAYLHEQKLIDGVLIVAWPSGVHHNWIANEFPAHMPERIPWYGHTWFTRQANQKQKRKGRVQIGKVSYNESFETLLAFKGLKVFAVNAEALRIKKQGLGIREALGRFMKSCTLDPMSKRRRVLVVGDESIFMQTPGKPRARIMRNLGKLSNYRRILDGTPVSNQGPLGLYTQLKFLDPSILGETGKDFNTCRAYYAEIEEQGDRLYNVAYQTGLQIAADQGQTGEEAEQTAKDYALSQGGKAWVAIKKDDEGKTRYRNLEEFRERIEPHTYRARFRDCFKDVPPPVYHSEVFELTTEQRRVYDDLAEQYRAELASGATVEADMVLTRYLRLQQITSNYWPAIERAHTCDTCGGEGCNDCDNLGVVVREGNLERIDTSYNPRLSHVLDIADQGDPWIIWARFDQEIDDVLEAARDRGIIAVRYDGMVSSVQKIKARDDFQGGRAQWFVAKQQSAGRGIPLWRARGEIFMSNTYSLGTRLQAEMRTEIAHRRVASELYDVLAFDTIDDKFIVPSLRANLEISDLVLGDPRRQWI